VTGGSLDPSGASGALDVFVRKYSPDGEVIWTRQSGTSGDDIARDVAVVGEGFVLVGEVRAALAGQSFGGGSDAFLTYYDTAGDPVWTRQFGGAGSEFIAAVAADESGVYVAGGTETALSGQVSMGGFDAFLRKYDLLGAELWTRQFGTVLTESVSDVGVDATGVFLVGATEGTMAGQLSRGAFDAFVRAYDLDGGVVWTRYVGTSASDDAFSISPYHLAVYIGGSTLGAFDLPNSGATDGYFVKILK
jgi:hypothetical protein